MSSYYNRYHRTVEILPDLDQLIVRFSFDRDLLDAFKAAIPSTARSWQPEQKVWTIAPQYGDTFAQLIQAHWGQHIEVPEVATPEPSRVAVEMHYLGACRPRNGAGSAAYGYDGTAWNLVFPEDALREWFGAARRPGEQTTLFGVLGLKPGATDGEVRKAYRRLAFQWHPDRCREPDAAEQFRTIQAAYDVLGDVVGRARYEAGLRLAGGLEQVAAVAPSTGYRAPLRCGRVEATGVYMAGKLNVQAIHAWEDLTDEAGRVCIPSWDHANRRVVEVWI